MKQKTASRLLHLLGWRAVEPPVPEKKCVILGVPHTCIADFFISWLYYTSVGGKARIMIKREFFRWPIRNIMINTLGAIPVDRSARGGASLIRQLIHEFDTREELHLCMAPEGTRKPVKRWKTGFHTIATAAGVPVYTGYFDWKKKIVGRGERIELTDDAQADLKRIRQWYKDKGVVGKYPEKFLLGDDLD